MSGTTGQYIGLAVGAVIGAFTGGVGFALVMGALYGASVGWGIGGMLDPPDVPKQEIDTQDLQYNTFQRNLPVPIVYGRTKIFGNVIYIGNAYSKVHETDSGGKGGGGGGTQRTVTYYATFCVSLSEGEIQNIHNVYKDDDDITNSEGTFWTKVLGSNTQTANSLIATTVSGDAPAWRNTAYLVLSGSLGKINRVPMISAVITGIEGGVPDDLTIGTWENYKTFPFVSNGLETDGYVIHAVANDDYSKIFIQTSETLTPECKFYVFDAVNGWLLKNTYTGYYHGSVLVSHPIYYKDNWWFQMAQGIGGATKLYYTGGSTITAVGAFDVGSTSTNTPAYVLYPHDGYVWFSRKTWNLGQSGIWLMKTLGGTPALESTAWPTSDFVIGGSKTLHGNWGGVITDTNGFTRFIAFNYDGTPPTEVWYLYYSDPGNPLVMHEVNINSYVDNMDSTVGWTKPVSTDTDKFYWVALANDGYLRLFDYELDVGVTQHAYVYPSNTPAVVNNIRVNGMFFWNGKLWIGLNVSGDGNENSLWGYYDFGNTTMVYLDWPSYPASGANASPEYRDEGLGAGKRSVSNHFLHDANYLRLLHTYAVGTTGGRYDIRCSIQQVGFQNSPAAAIWDFLTNTRYGMGIDTDKLDYASFKSVHDYCVTQVNGNDRFRLDIVLGEERSALDHLISMLQAFGGFLVWSEGVIKLKVRRSEASVASLNEDSIIADSLTFTYISLKDIPNRIKYEYRNRNDNFRHDFVFVNDEFDQDQTNEIREAHIQAPGVTMPDQAARLAQFYLDDAITNKIICNFRVGIRYLKFEVGDVVDITHTVPGWTSKEFRIMEISEEENDELAITCREYSSSIFHDEGPTTSQNSESYIPSIHSSPEHVTNLYAYEMNNDKKIKIMFGLAANPGYWEAAEIYRSLVSNLNYEFIGNTSLSTITGLVEAVIYPTDSMISVKGLTTTFPTFGTLVIEQEEITYTNFVNDGDTTGYFTGCQRGQNNTEAAIHAINAKILLYQESFEYDFNPATEAYTTIYFKALSVSVRNITAKPESSAPEAFVVPVNKWNKLLPVDNLQINYQGNDKTLPDVIDCIITWKGRNRYVGYGKMLYGQSEVGYGGGGNDPDFVSYRLQIETPSGTIIRIVNNITDEYYVYTSAMRLVDGTIYDTYYSADFVIKVYQRSSSNLSVAASLRVNT